MDNSAIPQIVPGQVTHIPPSFRVSVNVSFQHLTFEEAIELKKVLDNILKEVEVYHYSPVQSRKIHLPTHLTSTLSEINPNGF